MTVVVPDKINDLDKIIQNKENISPAYLKKYGYNKEINLYLPKFKIQSEIDLKDPLVEVCKLI